MQVVASLYDGGQQGGSITLTTNDGNKEQEYCAGLGACDLDTGEVGSETSVEGKMAFRKRTDYVLSTRERHFTHAQVLSLHVSVGLVERLIIIHVGQNHLSVTILRQRHIVSYQADFSPRVSHIHRWEYCVLARRPSLKHAHGGNGVLSGALATVTRAEMCNRCPMMTPRGKSSLRYS